MDINKIYSKLDSDFIKPGLKDDWEIQIEPITDFVTQKYKECYMGLICDNTKRIEKVYTAVFPSDSVIKKVLSKGKKSLLFVHHPATWDIRKAPQVFTPMNPDLLKQMRKQQISIYNLHVPLDNYGPYSTSFNLAKALLAEPKEAFAPYFGALCGVIAETSLETTDELKKVFESAVEHQVSIYQYGSKKITGKKVALVAGGGNDIETLEELVKKGINVFVTGITVRNAYSEKAHKFAKKNKISLLGGTHYSTEKFACQAMGNYFRKLGLPAEFISGIPVLEDL